MLERAEEGEKKGGEKEREEEKKEEKKKEEKKKEEKKNASPGIEPRIFRMESHNSNH